MNGQALFILIFLSVVLYFGFKADKDENAQMETETETEYQQRLLEYGYVQTMARIYPSDRNLVRVFDEGVKLKRAGR